MFGNWQGWLIAIVIVVVAVFLASQWFVIKGSEPERAVTKPGALDLVELASPPTVVYPNALTKPGNPGDDYAKAVAIYEDTANTRAIFDWTEEYDRLSQLQKWDQIPQPPKPILDIADLIIRAAPKQDMRYMFEHTPRSLEVAYEILPANRLGQLAEEKGATDKHDGLMYHLITYYSRTGQYDKAVELAQATFMMGWHMFNERAHANMMAHGLTIQWQTLRRLQEAYTLSGQPEKAAALDPYFADVKSRWSGWGEKLALVWGNPPKPGNLLYIIENDQDRAWRVQAVLALGITKFSATRPGDMVLLRKKILELCNDDDPFIEAAAEAARDMPLSQYRMYLEPPSYILTDTRFVSAEDDEENPDDEPTVYPDEVQDPEDSIDDSEFYE